LLVDAVMRIGRQRAPLARFKVHDVVADRATFQRQRGVVRLGEHRQVDPKTLVGRLGTAMDWKTKSTGVPADMARRAVVTWQSTHDCVGMSYSLMRSLINWISACVVATLSVAGFDADDGVAAAVEQAVENAGGDAFWVVGRMIGLQSHRKPAWQPNGVAELRDDRALSRDQDQILVAHDLRHGGDHLRR